MQPSKVGNPIWTHLQRGKHLGDLALFNSISYFIFALFSKLKIHFFFQFTRIEGKSLTPRVTLKAPDLKIIEFCDINKKCCYHDWPRFLEAAKPLGRQIIKIGRSENHFPSSLLKDSQTILTFQYYCGLKKKSAFYSVKKFSKEIRHKSSEARQEKVLDLGSLGTPKTYERRTNARFRGLPLKDVSL